jgi:hypothetical protein
MGANWRNGPRALKRWNQNEMVWKHVCIPYELKQLANALDQERQRLDQGQSNLYQERKEWLSEQQQEALSRILDKKKKLPVPSSQNR